MLRRTRVKVFLISLAFPGATGAQRDHINSSVAMFIAAGPDEYFAVGNGVTVTFSSNTPGTPLAGMGTVQEGSFVNGRWVPGRWLAGDDTARAII